MIHIAVLFQRKMTKRTRSKHLEHQGGMAHGSSRRPIW
jgi:hypothetical protein